MKEIIVNSNEAGQRMDKLLRKVLKEANDSFIYKMLRKKNIVLNRKKAEGKEILKEGDSIQIFFSDETFALMSGSDSDVKKQKSSYMKSFDTIKNVGVVYEDENILIMNKPQGVLTQKAVDSDLSLNEWMIGYLLSNNSISEESLKTFKPSVLNRLDRNTCGLVLGSKSLKGSQSVSEMLKNRSLYKYYRCVVNGKCELSGIFVSYLYKDEKNNKVTIFDHFHEIPDKIRNKTTEIKTGIQPVCVKDGKTELEIELFTGKTHQIRAQLQKLGFSIDGDIKYGTDKGNKKSSGQKLCSYRLVFPEITGELSNLSGKEILCPKPDFLLTK